MKLSKNYIQVTRVSKSVLAQAKEQSFSVGSENYQRQECVIKLGANNNDTSKVMVFLYFKGQRTYITSVANIPQNLLIEKGEGYEVVEKAVLEIKEGKIIS
jgi:hypothetical protein